jgi:predicted MPP superfamily phosphohydrolase
MDNPIAGPPVAQDEFELRIAIASDLHAYSSAALQGTTPPSLMEVLSSDTSPTTNPILGLKQLINDAKIRASMLVCPGDLGDKASNEGIVFAWEKLHEIGALLGASEVYATTGNHDVDSRHKDSNVDQNHTIKNLNPPYPTPDENQNNAYFARDFALVDGKNHRTILLNSSAHHGSAPEEQNHGRITPAALEGLRKRLSQLSPQVLSILICHHHPHQHSELKLGATDVMHDGQQLLDLLGTDGAAPWLIIHGHKHHPKITYAAGGTSSPVVFASGSLTAFLFPELGTATKNQFHVISIKSSDIFRFGLVGRISSWYWSHGAGWLPSNKSTGLPRETGFGFRGNLRLLAQQIADKIGDSKLLWQQLVQDLPELSFLLPQDFEFLREILRVRHNFGVQELDGLPYEVGRTQ